MLTILGDTHRATTREPYTYIKLYDDLYIKTQITRALLYSKIYDIRPIKGVIHNLLIVFEITQKKNDYYTLGYKYQQYAYTYTKEEMVENML